MSVGTLYTSPDFFFCKLIKVVAAFGNVSIEIDPEYKHMETNKTPEFLAKFPHGKVPAFESKDGFKLFEGPVIAKYIATLAPNSGLLGSSPTDVALIDQWIHLIETEFGIPTDFINGLIQNRSLPYSKPIHTFMLERQERTLATLNKHLAENNFLVGEHITLADLIFASYVQKGVSLTVDAPLRAKYTDVIRLFETIVSQPKLKEIYGETKYIEKGVQFVPPAQK